MTSPSCRALDCVTRDVDIETHAKAELVQYRSSVLLVQDTSDTQNLKCVQPVRRRSYSKMLSGRRTDQKTAKKELKTNLIVLGAWFLVIRATPYVLHAFQSKQ